MKTAVSGMTHPLPDPDESGKTHTNHGRREMNDDAPTPHKMIRRTLTNTNKRKKDHPE